MKDNSKEDKPFNKSGSKPQVGEEQTAQLNQSSTPPSSAGTPITESKSDTLGIVALVTGITGTVMGFCCYFLGIPLGITALVCGFMARSKDQRFAMAGIILGIVALVLSVLSIILFLLLGYAPYFFEQYYELIN